MDLDRQTDIPKCRKTVWIGVIGVLLFVACNIIFIGRNVTQQFQIPSIFEEEQEVAVARQLDPDISVAYTNISSSDRFAACLLCMDDNFRLPEWLAYHYHTLNLRRLIVTVDPKSRTSPQAILDRWGTVFEHIELWNDTTFGFKRNRQPLFYVKCMKRFLELGYEWTGLFDVDEFVRLNPSRIQNVTEAMWRPGAVATFLKESREDVPPENRTIQLTHPESKLDESLRGVFKADACFIMARAEFISSQRATNITTSNRGKYPHFIQEELFDTLQWNLRPREIGVNGKPFLNVQKIEKDLKASRTPKVHSAYGPRRCRPGRQPKGDFHIFLNHYIGSYEYFTYRQDSRGEKRIKRFHRRNSVNSADLAIDGEAVSPWLGGFIHHMGVQRAEELLKGVGVLEEW